MNRKKQIAIGAVLSYIQIAVGALITFLYTPFMMRVLGQSEYGLYNTVSSVIFSLSFLSLGFGSCYVKFYSRYSVHKETREISQLNGMFMTIFIIIGVVALICGLCLTYNLEIVFDKGLTSDEFLIAKKLMFILTLNLALSFPTSVFTSIITANERFVFQKIVLLVKQVVSPLLCIPLLLNGFASVGMVVCTVLVNSLSDILSIYFCVFKLKIKFKFGKFDLSIFKEMTIYASFIALNMIVDQINLNIDKFILARFKGTVAVAIYSAGYTIYHYYTSFSTSISNVFTPRVHQIWNSREDIEKRNFRLTELFTVVGRVQFIILLLVSSGLLLFGKQFIYIWAGPNYNNAYYILLLLSFTAIVPLSQNVGIEIQRAKNKHQFRAVLYFFMAIINLILSIYLCQDYGEIGCAIGTAFSFIIANTVCMNLFYNFVLKINVKSYWINSIKSLLACVPAFIVGYMFCRNVNTNSIPTMLLGIILYSIAYIVFQYLFACSKQEKSRVRSLLKKEVK